MVVHIAAIGTETAHVHAFIRETQPCTKLYLIHSKKNAKIDFPKKARDLEKKINAVNSDVKIIKRSIENAFNLHDTYDAITVIIGEERVKNHVANDDIKINVTGGTNAMAAAAMLAATIRGTKAYYVLDTRKKELGPKYVVKLPVPAIGIAKLNSTQQEVLRLVSEGTFVSLIKVTIKEEGHKTMIQYDLESAKCDHCDGTGRQTTGITKCDHCDGTGHKSTGAITHTEILAKFTDTNKKSDTYGQKMGLDQVVSYASGKRKRSIRKGENMIAAAVKELVNKDYVEKLDQTPVKVTTDLGGGKQAEETYNIKRIMYRITELGIRHARDIMLLGEKL